MEYGLRLKTGLKKYSTTVLILVVMEYGLRLDVDEKDFYYVFES